MAGTFVNDLIMALSCDTLKRFCALGHYEMNWVIILFINKFVCHYYMLIFMQVHFM